MKRQTKLTITTYYVEKTCSKSTFTFSTKHSCDLDMKIELLESLQNSLRLEIEVLRNELSKKS